MNYCYSDFFDFFADDATNNTNSKMLKTIEEILQSMPTLQKSGAYKIKCR